MAFGCYSVSVILFLSFPQIAHLTVYQFIWALPKIYKYMYMYWLSTWYHTISAKYLTTQTVCVTYNMDFGSTSSGVKHVGSVLHIPAVMWGIMPAIITFARLILISRYDANRDSLHLLCSRVTTLTLVTIHIIYRYYCVRSSRIMHATQYIYSLQNHKRSRGFAVVAGQCYS